VELEVGVADPPVQVVGVGLVRPQRAGREDRPAVLGRGDGAAAELTDVDDPVVATGQLVAIEAGEDPFVSDHPKSGLPARLGVRSEVAGATHLVDVAVGVDEGVDRRRRPAS